MVSAAQTLRQATKELGSTAGLADDKHQKNMTNGGANCFSARNGFVSVGFFFVVVVDVVFFLLYFFGGWEAVRDGARQTEETEIKEGGDGERDKLPINSFHYPVAAAEYSSLIDSLSITPPPIPPTPSSHLFFSLHPPP